ncbi:MAG TPA: CDF family Co(II)/Ni(II) efflux transporter DmeF [Croceibacterium sp.]|nr:CDF family Co(II)/Ni(II) efflux transporter DmeF [Croceibacterium sp.]
MHSGPSHDHGHHHHHHHDDAQIATDPHGGCKWAPGRGYFLGSSHDRNARKTAWVLALCAVTMVVEVVAGLMFGSMALLADGLHMATHAGVMLVAAAAYRIAWRRRADPSFSLGTGKVGDLAAFASALALAATAVGLAIESGRRLFEPVPIAFDEAIPVAFLGLVVNLLSVWLLHDDGHDHGHGHGHGHSHGHSHAHQDHDDHDHDHEGHDHKHHHDLNLRAAYAHVVSDAGLGVMAIAGLFAARELGWVWLDPVLGILAAVVIFRWSVGLLRAAGAVLLDKVPDEALARRIRARLERDGARVTDFHLWRVGPGHHALIVSLAGASQPVSHYRGSLGDISTLAHVTIETDEGAAG